MKSPSEQVVLTARTTLSSVSTDSIPGSASPLTIFATARDEFGDELTFTTQVQVDLPPSIDYDSETSELDSLIDRERHLAKRQDLPTSPEYMNKMLSLAFVLNSGANTTSVQVIKETHSKLVAWLLNEQVWAAYKRYICVFSPSTLSHINIDNKPHLRETKGRKESTGIT